MPTAKMLPSGSWNAIKYSGKSPDGKRQYKSFTADTKEEAEYLAAEYGINRSQSNNAANFTIGAAYDKYIESKSNVLSPATVREYKRSRKKDLQELMPVKLKDLTQEKVQIAINQAALTHSPKSIRNMHGLLSAVLSVYRPSFSLHTSLPQKVNSEIFIPTDAQIKALLAATGGKPLHNAILLGSVGALRRSEVCALLDTDVKENGVQVTKAMVYDGKEWRIKTTKTTASKRFVELPTEIIKELRKTEGRIYRYTPGTLTDQFLTLTKQLFGESFRFHDLRHYAASVLHAMGIPDMYIMARGGWASRITLNKVYTHIISEEQKKFNEQINSHFTDALLK